MFKMKVLPILLCWFILCSYSSMADEYIVSISEIQPRIVSIKAALYPDGQIISMNEQNVHGLKKGWGGFVKNINIKGSDGNNIQTVEVENSKWKLIGYDKGKIELSYDVVLGHDLVTPKIKFGDNGAAYATKDGVMWAGRAIFIAGKPSKKVSIQFRLPSAWHVTNAWGRDNDDANLFYAQSTSDIQNSAFFAGTHTHGTISAGNVNLRTAFSGEYTHKIVDDINQKVELFFEYYAKQYQSPLKSRMVLIVADRNDGGGEVMGKAISISVGPKDKKQLDKSPVLPQNISRLIAHELFHGFAFNQLELDDGGEKAFLYEWFNEGFGAEYASQLALLRTGVKNESAFLAGILYRMKEYESEFDGKLTLVSAGADKSDKSTTVYWGGLIAALSLDFKIRSQSNGKQNLDELWQYLLKNYPKGGKKSLNLNKIYKTAHKLYGNAIAKELEAYANQPTLIPFYESARLMGLQYYGKTLSRNHSATKKQQALWASFIAN